MPQSESQLTAILEKCLKSWQQDDALTELQTRLPYVYRQIGPSRHHGYPVSTTEANERLLLSLIDALGDENDLAAQILHWRYIENLKGAAVADRLNLSESGFYRHRREALEALAEAAERLEQQARQTHMDILIEQLEPPTYQKLVGVEAMLHRLQMLLKPASEIRLLCLAGMGGLGKTALADALARRVIAKGEFDELAWVSARQSHLNLTGKVEDIARPVLTTDQLVTNLDRQLKGDVASVRPPKETLAALKMRFKQGRHLVIIDNLETFDDFEALFPLLRELSQLAWIVVTSRVVPLEQPDIHITSLTELGRANAGTLIREEARRRGLDELATSSTETIDHIYNIVGGSPLALKLVMGQVQVRSLSRVLTDLREARGKRAEALYDFIYHHSWNLLDENARKLLLTLPFAAERGTTRSHLINVSKLSPDNLDDAIEQLTRLSLLIIGGTLQQRRYSIHRLTVTFLHKQVTKWF